MKGSWKHIWASVLVLGLLVVPAFAEVATEDDAKAETETTEAAAEKAHEVTFAGMKIAIDPETGRMRPPTARESKRLERKMRRMFRKIHRHHESSGLVAYSGTNRSAVLDQSHLNFEVLHIDAEGNLVGQCVNGTEPAAESLANVVEPASEREEM